MSKREELVRLAQDALDANWRENHRMMAEAAVSAILAGLKDTSPEYLRALEAEGVSFATYNRVMQAMLSAIEEPQ